MPHPHCTLILQLLNKKKYSRLEKIKTIGSTYMVASGLCPGKEEVSIFAALLFIPFLLPPSTFALTQDLEITDHYLK